MSTLGSDNIFKHHILRLIAPGPNSSYSCLVNQRFWKVSKDARMEPPIQEVYFRFEGAVILIWGYEQVRKARLDGGQLKPSCCYERVGTAPSRCDRQSLGITSFHLVKVNQGLQAREEGRVPARTILRYIFSRTSTSHLDMEL